MLFSEFSRRGFDPFLEMRRMQQEMNRRLAGLGAAGTQEFPPMNLWASDDSVVVTAELPGLDPQSIDVSVLEDTLTLRGNREKMVDGEATRHRQEISYGTFARTVQLPFRVDPNQVQARFLNGVLEIELKRPESDLPKKIEIRSE